MITRDDYSQPIMLMEEEGPPSAAAAGSVDSGDSGDPFSSAFVPDPKRFPSFFGGVPPEIPSYQTPANILTNKVNDALGGLSEAYGLKMTHGNLFSGLQIKMEPKTGNFTYNPEKLGPFLQSIQDQAAEGPDAAEYMQGKVNGLIEGGYLKEPTVDSEKSGTFMGMEGEDWATLILGLTSAGMAFYYNQQQLKLYRDQFEEDKRRYDESRSDNTSQFERSLALQQQQVDQSAGGGGVNRGTGATYN